MDDADSTGISQYILKMSIVQAGSEVTNLKRQHAAWVKDAESKMSRLVKGAEDAVVARERLEKAHAELASFQVTQSSKIQGVLMALAGGCGTALLHTALCGWHNYCKKMKVENAIFEEYRDKIEEAEQRLIDAKAAQLKSVRGMIDKKHAGGVNDLIQEVFTIWSDGIFEARRDLAAAAEVAAMEERLKNCADHQSANAKKSLGKVWSSIRTGPEGHVLPRMAWLAPGLLEKQGRRRCSEAGGAKNQRLHEVALGKCQGSPQQYACSYHDWFDPRSFPIMVRVLEGREASQCIC